MPPAGPGIVGFIRVRHYAVGKRRLDRPTQDIRSGHGRNFLATVCPGELNRGTARRQLRAGNHRRKRVEKMMLRLLDYLCRKSALMGFAHVDAEPGHDGARSEEHT